MDKREEIAKEIGRLVRSHSYVGKNKEGVEAILDEEISHEDCLLRTADFLLKEIEKAEKRTRREIAKKCWTHCNDLLASRAEAQCATTQKINKRVRDAIKPLKAYFNEIINQNKESEEKNES